MRRSILLLAAMVFAMVAGIFSPTPVAAQDQRCFNETGFCISGRFRSYWEQNGGLAVFGFPTTNVFTAQDENGVSRPTQLFERNIFELHADKAAPYDVLLARLGDSILLLSNYDWQAQPRDPAPVSGCTWFAETQFNVCNQGGSIGFKTYWASHGLEFDGRAGTSYAESLALFGFPLTAPYVAENPNGDTVLMQWFERARFEWHPNNPVQFRVLLGLLGNEYVSIEPDPQPEPQPGDQCANIRSPIDASISPNCVSYGGTIDVVTYGWDSGQPLGYWITDQNGITVGTTQTVNADTDGSFSGTIDTTNWFGLQLGAGDYNFVVSDARNVSPGDKYQDSIAPFRVLP